MTRMKGFEEIADELGHCAEFITATCPSEYHAYNADGNANPNYKGHSVRDGQAWLNRIWQKARAKFARLGILIYGFRIAEPHHDGTPHWHMVLFTLPAHRDALRAVFREYWLSECGGEPGARIHRIKFKSIDAAKGSATGYISKYVAKNIDGHEVGEDYEANPAASLGDRWEPIRQPGQIEVGAASEKSATHATNTAARVGAWAALHGIRQFQQIGGPQVTIYRELRRVRHDRGGSGLGDSLGGERLAGTPSHVAPIERARVCADAGDWRGFIVSIGGIAAGRKGALSLWKEETGECNAYGDAREPPIVGVAAILGRIRTRTQVWQVIRLAQGLTTGANLPRPTAPKMNHGPGSAALTPWAVSRRVQLLTRVQGGAEKSGPGLSEPRGWTNPQESSMYGPN